MQSRREGRAPGVTKLFFRGDSSGDMADTEIGRWGGIGMKVDITQEGKIIRR